MSSAQFHYPWAPYRGEEAEVAEGKPDRDDYWVLYDEQLVGSDIVTLSNDSSNVDEPVNPEPASPVWFVQQDYPVKVPDQVCRYTKEENSEENPTDSKAQVFNGKDPEIKKDVLEMSLDKSLENLTPDLDFDVDQVLREIEDANASGGFPSVPVERPNERNLESPALSAQSLDSGYQEVASSTIAVPESTYGFVNNEDFVTLDLASLGDLAFFVDGVEAGEATIGTNTNEALVKDDKFLIVDPVENFHAYAQKPGPQGPDRVRGRPSNEVRKAKKKEQNKTAAKRYRMKKKQDAGTVCQEEAVELEKNKNLKKEVERLEMEISLLKKLMCEIGGRKV